MPPGSGVRTYPMLHPVRSVPAQEPSSSVPYTVQVTTRSHMSVIIGPSAATGPTATHVPLSGHNLLLTITADAGKDVVIDDLAIDQVTHAPLDADGISVIFPEPIPPSSPDFIEPILRSAAAYQPLLPPDLEVDLGAGTVRPVAGSAPARRIPVAAGQTVRLVLAPITEVYDLVRWRLRADISCAARTTRFLWELMTTAHTCTAAYSPNGAARTVPIQERFPDHWHRGATPEAIVAAKDAGRGQYIMPMMHTSADGSAMLRRSIPDTDPESEHAASLRRQADERARRGSMEEASATYAAAAEAGSAEAAFKLGVLADAEGNAEAAQHWYTQAAERNFFPAFNDLAALYFRLGEPEQASYWYRRGMDAGDWTAAAGYGTLLWALRDPDAEPVLRMVADTIAGAPTMRVIGDDLARSDLRATTLAKAALAELCYKQERVDEAVRLWQESADGGNPHAAHWLGKVCLAENDRVGAARWWRESADAGFALSAYDLGRLCHEDGLAAEAERYWRKAAAALEPALTAGASADTGRTIVIGRPAQSGEVLSAYELGMILLNRGKAAEARHWLTLAARAGHRGARYELAAEPDVVPGFSHAEHVDGQFVDPMSRAIRSDDWLVLPESDWRPVDGSTGPPPDAIVGGWMLDEHGGPGPFRPNPDYVPGDKTAPTDPVDELLRLIAAGRSEGVAERLLAALRNAVVEIACDEQQRMLIGQAPDGAMCVPIVTAAVHKRRIPEARWVPVLGGNLPEIVRSDIDILINPDGPAQFRLRTDALRHR